jgi:hypothetical protein
LQPEAQADAPQEDRDAAFSLVVGGPFHAILGRLHLLGPDQLPTLRTALLLALLVWLPPAVLALVEAFAWGRSETLGFFTDPTIPTRFLLATATLIATERHADSRVGLIVRQFRGARIVAAEGLRGFQEALARADRRSSSALAEAVLLAGAFAVATITEREVVTLGRNTWEGALVAGQVVLSRTGMVENYFSAPLFAFLLLRWLWRFLVWSVLLFRVSRLPLQLTPLHPDRSAGLGFLTVYPGVFSGFVFAMSCVVASMFLREVHLHHVGLDAIQFRILGWLAAVLVVFIGPLLVFTGPLVRCRERALLEYGRLANQHQLAFHRKWIVENRDGEELLVGPEASAASDLNATVGAALALRTVPFDRTAVLQLLALAGLPMLAVIASKMPLLEFAQRVAGAVL